MFEVALVSGILVSSWGGILPVRRVERKSNTLIYLTPRSPECQLIL